MLSYSYSPSKNLVDCSFILHLFYRVGSSSNVLPHLTRAACHFVGLPRCQNCSWWTCLMSRTHFVTKWCVLLLLFVSSCLSLLLLSPFPSKMLYPNYFYCWKRNERVSSRQPYRGYLDLKRTKFVLPFLTVH